MKHIWKNLIDKPYGGAQGIRDNVVSHHTQNLLATSYSSLNDDHINYEFLGEYKKWIQSSKTNNIVLKDEWHYVYSNGTTESFTNFYLTFIDRRFVVLNGEYFYHKISFNRLNMNWDTIISPDDLQPNDAFIISLPFSDIGSEHPMMNELLDKCEELGIPVLLDACYFGLCQGVTFPTDHPAVHTITFSMSKAFDVANIRIGMRVTKEDNDDPLFVYHKNGYTNRVGAHVGLGLIKEFDVDYFPKTYGKYQTKICSDLNVTPSKCVNLATSTDNKWNYLNRGNEWNRINLSKRMI